jgi:hypothetical protein
MTPHHNHRCQNKCALFEPQVEYLDRDTFGYCTYDGGYTRLTCTTGLQLALRGCCSYREKV